MQIEMPPAETKQFLSLMSKAEIYLEYGSGGSTVAASQSTNIKSIITVESDAEFLKNVVESLPDSRSAFHAVHVDIGPTKEWGYPARSGTNYKKFPNYAMAPWSVCNKLSISPDLILIDGRFRVSSFIYSALNAKIGAILFFDDYMNRPHYHCISKIFRPTKVVGRSATFKVTKNFDRSLAVHFLLRSVVDSR